MASSYSLDDFMTQYNLPQPEAERIFRITGSLRADLDALMAAKSHRATAREWALDPYRKIPSVASSNQPDT
jgi:hypothetical protein